MDIVAFGSSEALYPDFKIYDYTSGIYKIIRFKSTAPRVGPHIDSTKPKGELKLDAAISRARKVVLELALCNDWKYFCTFTVSKDKFNRYDLDAWHKAFTQWIRDLRKKYNLNFQFLLVPELHDDGAWHMHGLFSDISPVLVSFRDLASTGTPFPKELIDGNFFNFPDYQKKFGFCSFGLIRSREGVSFYITKYISKSLVDNCLKVGKHLYYPSRGLNRASLHGEIYGNCQALEKYLVNHYEFCDTGFTSVKDKLDWSFAFEYMDHTFIDFFASDHEEPEVDHYMEVVQSVMEGF